MDETNSEETRWEMSNPTSGEWTLVPVELDGYTHHFKVMQSNVLIYEGITSESQGAHLINAHNAALAAEREKQGVLALLASRKSEEALANLDAAVKSEVVILQLREQLAARCFDPLCELHNPKPTSGERKPNEWTSEMVQATLKDRPFAASTIASHHNAAVKEAYEKGKQDAYDQPLPIPQRRR